MSVGTRIDAAVIRERMRELFVGAPGADLRREDRRKAVEVAALLDEVALAVRRAAVGRPLRLVDAAAGKGYVGLFAAELVLAGRKPAATVVCLEREPQRAGTAEAAGRGGLRADAAAVTWRVGDVGDRALWPARPDVVTALHACGPASDAVIEAAIAAEARTVLLVPCCTGDAVLARARAAGVAESLGVPARGPLRQRLTETLVSAARTLRFEAAGWQTEVVELVAPTVTPYNLLWRARRVGEPGRMRAAAASLQRLEALLADPGE